MGYGGIGWGYNLLTGTQGEATSNGGNPSFYRNPPSIQRPGATGLVSIGPRAPELGDAERDRQRKRPGPKIEVREVTHAVRSKCVRLVAVPSVSKGLKPNASGSHEPQGAIIITIVIHSIQTLQGKEIVTNRGVLAKTNRLRNRLRPRTIHPCLATHCSCLLLLLFHC